VREARDTTELSPETLTRSFSKKAPLQQGQNVPQAHKIHQFEKLKARSRDG
jgi:hypothetical protein